MHGSEAMLPETVVAVIIGVASGGGPAGLACRLACHRGATVAGDCRPSRR